MSRLQHYYEISYCDSIDNCKELLGIFSSYLMGLMVHLHRFKSQTEQQLYTRLFIQHLFLKTRSFSRLLEGENYCNGVLVSHIVDCSSLLSITRDIYEQLYAFELVFVLPQSNDIRNLMRNLFIMQGLKERQKYVADDSKYQKIKQTEAAELEERSNAIRNLDFYKSLSKLSRNNLENHIKNCRFRIVVREDGSIRKSEYDEMPTLVGIKKGLYDTIYSFTSIHAHPSSVSLKQLNSAYSEDEWLTSSCAASHMVCMLLSIFIADYCKLEPESLDFYKKQSDEIRFAIAFQNHCIRSEDYSIIPREMEMLINTLEMHIQSWDKY